MKTIAYTGFGPFGENKTNPTMELVALIEDTENVNAHVVPVSYSRSYLEAKKIDGDILLMSGLAASRKEISIEVRAYNERKASIPDNDGLSHNGDKIDDRTEEFLETTIQVEPLLKKLKDENISVELSTDPGRYVCNNIYYMALSDNTRPSLFVHFPTNETMPIEVKERALRTIIDYLKEL